MQEKLAPLPSRLGPDKPAYPLNGDLPWSTLVGPQSFGKKGLSSGRLRHLDGWPADLATLPHPRHAAFRLSRVLCSAVKLEYLECRRADGASAFGRSQYRFASLRAAGCGLAPTCRGVGCCSRPSVQWTFNCYEDLLKISILGSPMGRWSAQQLLRV
jgi:hypothetical protein